MAVTFTRCVKQDGADMSVDLVMVTRRYPFIRKVSHAAWSSYSAGTDGRPGDGASLHVSYAADQTLPGAGNATAAAIATGSPRGLQAERFLTEQARLIRDRALRSETLDILSPHVCIRHRIRFAVEAAKDVVVQKLLAAGLVSPPAMVGTISTGITGYQGPPGGAKTFLGLARAATARALARLRFAKTSGTCPPGGKVNRR